MKIRPLRVYLITSKFTCLPTRSEDAGGAFVHRLPYPSGRPDEDSEPAAHRAVGPHEPVHKDKQQALGNRARRSDGKRREALRPQCDGRIAEQTQHSHEDGTSHCHWLNLELHGREGKDKRPRA